MHCAYVVLWLSPHSILTSLEPADLNDDLTGLSEVELGHLEEIYKDPYLKKYPIVGTLVPPDALQQTAATAGSEL